MHCPNGCGRLQATQYAGALVDVCLNCIGVWVTETELRQVAAQPTQSWPQPAIDAVVARIGKPGIGSHQHVSGVQCPSCSDELCAQNYNELSGIVIQACPRGHGAWLEGGQMGQIQIYTEYWSKVLTELNHRYPESTQQAVFA